MGFYETLRMELNAKKSQSNNQSISITMVCVSHEKIENTFTVSYIFVLVKACPGFIKTELTMGAGIGKDGKPFGELQITPLPNVINISLFLTYINSFLY